MRFLKHLPMDIGKVVCSVLLPIFRVKRLTPTGEKYKGKIKGGAVIASNHASFSDPFVAGITFWYRRMYMLVAEVVMKNKLRSFLLRGMGAIRVDRGIADIEAVKKCVGVLKEGHILLVFPQGAITEGDEVASAKSGAVLMALQSKTPIIPIYIKKREHWYSKTYVVIGDAIDPTCMLTKKIPSTADIEKITNALVESMNECRKGVK